MKFYKLSFISLAALSLTSCALFDNLRGSSSSSSELSTEVVFSPDDPIVSSVDTTPRYVCSFYDYDASLLYQATVKSGESVEYEGPTPTRPEWQGAYYEFTGWDKSLKNIRSDTDFLPEFREYTKSYTVRFVARGTVVQEDVVPFMGKATYRGNTDDLAYTEDSVQYTFSSWGVDLTEFQITEDTVFEAKYVGATVGLTFNRFRHYDEETHQYTDGYEVSGQGLDATSVIIPEIYNGRPVLRIADSGFLNNQKIQVVTCPKTLISIGNWAFQNDSNLTQVNMEEGIATIGDRAFYQTPSLETIVLQLGLKTLGNEAFAYSGIVSLAIPRLMESLGNYAFSNCPNLKELDLTKAELQLSEGLFSNDPKLETVELNSAMETVPARLFENCTGLKNVVLPRYMRGINERAFAGCVNLNNVEIPAKTQYIGREAFNECESLANISFAGEEFVRVGEYAFANCKALTQITLPDSLERIEYGAFVGSGLKAISIGEGLEYLANDAFANTPFYEDEANYRDGMYYIFARGEESAYVYRSSDARFVRLREETKLFAEGLSFPMLTLQLPESLCGDLTFLSTVQLSELVLEGQSDYVVENGCIYLNDALVRCFGSLLVKVELPENVRTVGARAFEGLYNLKTVTLNEGLERIEESSFANNGVRLLELPSSVTFVHSRLFNEEKAKYLLLPAGLDPIFSSGRSEISVYENYAGEQGEIEGFSYFIADEKAIVYAYNWRDYAIEFPSEIDGRDVTELAAGFTWSNTYDIAEKIILPEKLVRLGRYAMSSLNNEALKEITVPNTIREIETEGLFIGSGYVVLPEELRKVEAYGIRGNEGKIFSELAEMPTNDTYAFDFYTGATVYWFSATPIYDGQHWHYTGGGETLAPTIYEGGN